MRRAAAVLVIALCAAGCAENPDRIEVARTGHNIPIAPYELHEECIPLEEGERIEYRFLATAPVDFDIHYHEGNALIMPVTRPHTTDEAGDFTPSRTAIHCLVWEAGVEGSVLEFRLRPLPPPQ